MGTFAILIHVLNNKTKLKNKIMESLWFLGTYRVMKAWIIF